MNVFATGASSSSRQAISSLMRAPFSHARRSGRQRPRSGGRGVARLGDDFDIDLGAAQALLDRVLGREEGHRAVSTQLARLPERVAYGVHDRLGGCAVLRVAGHAKADGVPLVRGVELANEGAAG